MPGQNNPEMSNDVAWRIFAGHVWGVYITVLLVAAAAKKSYRFPQTS
jgi:hypothetical protein